MHLQEQRLKRLEMIMDVREPHRQGHPDEKEHMDGARGADFDGMKIHSVRLPGFLAHQQVLLGSKGSCLQFDMIHSIVVVSCQEYLMAIRNVMERENLVYGLENIIE